MAPENREKKSFLVNECLGRIEQSLSQRCSSHDLGSRNQIVFLDLSFFDTGRTDPELAAQFHETFNQFLEGYRDGNELELSQFVPEKCFQFDGQTSRYECPTTEGDLFPECNRDFGAGCIYHVVVWDRWPGDLVARLGISAHLHYLG